MQLWKVESQLPFKTQAQFIKDPFGKNYWVLNMRVDFDLSDTGLTVSEEQQEPTLSTIYEAEPGESSVAFETDFVTFKPNTDIVITGKVRSKTHHLENQLSAQLVVEPHINKRVKFYGEREWVTHASQLTVGKAKVLLEAKISYGNAIGGQDNKIGLGVADSMTQLLETEVPSQFYVDQDWQYDPSNILAASFEPLAPFMSLRSQYAGTYDQTWFDEQYPLKPLDFDHRFNQQSPPDQQWDGRIQGGERFVLAGFFSEGEREFVVPKEQFSAVFKHKQGQKEKRFHLYTINIDTDRNLVSAIWHVAYECDVPLTEIVGVEVIRTQGREEVNS